MGQSYIPTLNGWRAIAVMLVIGSHASVMMQNSGTAVGSFAASIFSHAGIGVDVFFAISGYLICSLLLKEKSIDGTIDLPAFYRRRAFRILPALIGYLAAIGTLREAGILPTVSIGELLSSLLFVRNYFDGSWYTGHFWSLAIEEHFYIFVPVMLMVLSWKNSLRLAIAIAVACATIRLLESGLPDLKVEFRTEARLDAIMYGAIFALIVFRFRPAFEHYLTLPTVAGAVILAILLCYLLPYMPLRRTVLAMMMPVLIVYTTINYKSAFGQFLEWKPLQWVGKLSYSLYIWQMLFLVSGERAMPWVQGFPISFVFIIGCASASYYLIERPFIALGHQISSGSAPKLSTGL
jgi:peptidoglycan/LPS O-acetylase OafA/YrhL